MNRLGKIGLCVFAAAAICGGVLRPAGAISRDEVMVRAMAYAYHPWTCTTANLTASCDAGYQSVHVPGDYLGLPYDWGGYMTLFQFDQQIAQGYGAGSYPADGILSCTSGVDCSGYVSKCWDAGHTTTSGMDTISSQIAQGDLLPGDALNTPGYHVVLFSHLLGTGEPIFYEAVGYNTHINVTGGWSYVAGYDPIRYDSITGTTVGNPVGTPDNPIVIGSFPYSDSRDTTQAVSDVLDGCGLVPSTSEAGPEYIYQVTFTQPGQLTVAVSDDVGVDIDVHLYTSMNTSDCVARHDSSFTYAVDCGTYYIVADTYVGSQAYPGPYQLTVDFTPSGGGCGSGPPTYDFEGELGDACAYSGNPNLPFCNENLGSEICIYSTNPPTSFCSKSCQGSGDCAAFPGGCCEDIGSNELYCLTADFCDGPTNPDAGVPDGGLVPADGGVVGPDGGTTPDGGSHDGGTTPDGGQTPGGDSSGCSTSSSGGSLLGLVLVLLLALRRRL
jgi:uncharacterized protein (TIGR03382 family)